MTTKVKQTKMEELILEKTSFKAEHSAERKKIGGNGRKSLRQEHTLSGMSEL